jgi:hypothetical protein
VNEASQPATNSIVNTKIPLTASLYYDSLNSFLIALIVSTFVPLKFELFRLVLLPTMGSPGGLAAKGDASTFVSSTPAVAEEQPAQPSHQPPPSSAAPPRPPPLFLAAQQGDLTTLHELLATGQAKATDRDSGNITALHWAAINNRLLASKELLSFGADVDAVGGELLATPLQWAAR